MKKIIIFLVLLGSLASCTCEKPCQQLSHWLQYNPSDIYIGYFTPINHR